MKDSTRAKKWARQVKRESPMSVRRHRRADLVARANKLRDKSYQLKPSQWHRAIFTLRQHGQSV